MVSFYDYIEEGETQNVTIYNGTWYNPNKKANEVFDKMIVDGTVYEDDALDVMYFDVEMTHSENPHTVSYYIKSEESTYYALPSSNDYEKVTIGEGFTSLTLGNYLSIDTLHLPNSLKTIEDYCFMANIRTMNIPKNVTSIGHSALDFWNNTLETLYIECDVPPTIYSDSIIRVPETAVFYVKPELVETYKTADIWSNFASKIQPMP